MKVEDRQRSQSRRKLAKHRHKQLLSWLLRSRPQSFLKVLLVCCFFVAVLLLFQNRWVQRKLLILFGVYESVPETRRLLRQFERLSESEKAKFVAAKLIVTNVTSLNEIRQAHGSEESTDFAMQCGIFDRISNGAPMNRRCHLMRVQTADILPFLTLGENTQLPPLTVPNPSDKNEDDTHNNAPKNERSAVAEKLTVVLNTWRREDCLLSVIRHWQQCAEVVEAIVVVSADPTSEDRWAQNPSLRSALSSGWPVPVRIHPKAFKNDRLTHRFLFDGSVMKTDALFSVDDDLVYNCSLLKHSFALWLALGKQTAIGFEPRNVRFDYVSGNSHSVNSAANVRSELESESKAAYGVNSCDSTFGHCRYNAAFMTLGGIMHRRYYEAYFSDSMRFVRQIVDGNVTAEDLAMSFMYSSLNGGKPPLAVLYADTDVAYMPCEKMLSDKMHSNKNIRRINVAMDTLSHLGFDSHDSGLQRSPVFVSFV